MCWNSADVLSSCGWMHAALRARHLARFRICVQIERLPKWTQIFAIVVNFSRCSERTVVLKLFSRRATRPCACRRRRAPHWRSRARFDRHGCCCCSCCCMRRTYPRPSSGSGPIRRIRSLILGLPATSGKPTARKSAGFVAFRAPHVGHLRPNGWTAVSCPRILFFDVLTRAASKGFRQCRSRVSPRSTQVSKLMRMPDGCRQH